MVYSFVEILQFLSGKELGVGVVLEWVDFLFVFQEISINLELLGGLICFGFVEGVHTFLEVVKVLPHLSNELILLRSFIHPVGHIHLQFSQ